MTWCVPQRLSICTYINILSTSSSVWVLWAEYICCAQIVLGAYQFRTIFNKCIQFTKEKYIGFISQSHAWLSTQTKNVHTNVRCAYVVQGEDGTWCLSNINIKVTRSQKWPPLSVCYHAFTVDYCLLTYLLLPKWNLLDFKWNSYSLL